MTLRPSWTPDGALRVAVRDKFGEFAGEVVPGSDEEDPVSILWGGTIMSVDAVRDRAAAVLGLIENAQELNRRAARLRARALARR